MNAIMRDLTAVILACRETPLGSAEPHFVHEARHMIREAEAPELAACYDRIAELEGLLKLTFYELTRNWTKPDALNDCAVAIGEVLDPWSEPLLCDLASLP